MLARAWPGAISGNMPDARRPGKAVPSPARRRNQANGGGGSVWRVVWSGCDSCVTLITAPRGEACSNVAPLDRIEVNNDPYPDGGENENRFNICANGRAGVWPRSGSSRFSHRWRRRASVSQACDPDASGRVRGPFIECVGLGADVSFVPAAAVRIATALAAIAKTAIGAVLTIDPGQSASRLSWLL